MKRIIAFVLCVAAVLGLMVGCSGGSGEQAGTKVEKFSVGYAKVDITPTESVPLRGYGDAMERFSTGTLQPIYATCVAFADTDGQVLLLVSHDLGNSFTDMFDDLRTRAAEATGLPKSNIMFTASHSHSSPDVARTNVEAIVRYIEWTKEQCIQGIKDAIADLAPATMETGFNRVDRVATTRHYLLSDGTYQGDDHGSVKSKMVGHATKADNLLQVVKFTREGEKAPVVLVNWLGHPKKIGGSEYTLVSPNYPGVLRDALAEKYGYLVSFVLSGSGNVNNSSYIEGEVAHSDYRELGNRLTDEVSTILETKLTPGKLDKIHVSENLYTTKASEVAELTVPLYAFSIGDWACATAPFEIFDTNSMAVRDASKFKMTFFASCANENYSYLPTPPSYDWAIAYEARITKFPAGTSDLIQNELIKQLDQIFEESGNEIVDKGEGYNTPKFVPVSDGLEYTNPNPGDLTQCKEVANGFYAIRLLVSGTVTFKDMLCIDKETAEAVAAQASMKLLFNESNVIMGLAE